MEKSIESLEKELLEEKRKNVLLRNVAVELAKLSPLKEKLDNILELLDDNFNLKHTMLLFPAKKDTILRVFASRGFCDLGIGVEIPFNYGVVGTVASKKKKLRISRLSQYRKYANAFHKKDKSASQTIKLPGLPNAESLVALPLIANNELVAVLSCESEDILFFHKSDEVFLMTLSQQIAVSIQNSIVFEQLEERVKLRTKELENLNKTKDRLFSIIGHDLRSPVTSLEGIAELFEYYNAKGKNEQLLALGPRISFAAKNVNQLLDNLLNWSLGQQEGLQCSPQKIDLQPLIKDVHHLFTDFIASKHIRFLHFDDDKASVFADYNMIFSVLRNVISNSIKFTPSGGQIEVSTNDIEDNVQITIKDTGIGMDHEKIETLFSLQENKSTLGTDREKGSGLGLVLVNEFMLLNKGTINIESSKAGTSIHLLLPRK
ncbi:signal transduction histidine kinase [Gillisia sp. Hel_I_86]|uniref:GAF domain-containing sensor histidine kinase n=1 Tax=Gillisia sp. Hel_I_86 TaxID=1249981 RepID=UPI00119B7783|nr:GAF domain-containing sensor histidine kinase [Gillisia sp. Hel_I_86]TVZ26913.1 signal transduction histidine kinase [Gillisia sp. Hel_I_86]